MATAKAVAISLAKVAAIATTKVALIKVINEPVS
jgi:hypothetical protein